MANEKKTSRKKFRVAVSGSTVDGREISPVHLREAAENFNPDVYAARVNVEHYLSPCPSSEFSAMGDVTALSTEDITEGPLAGRTALYAEIEPTERMKQLVADGKKIYSSIELHPQFSVTDAGRDGCRRGFVRLYRTTGHPPGDCHRPGHAGRSARQIMQSVRLCPPWPE